MLLLLPLQLLPDTRSMRHAYSPGAPKAVILFFDISQSVYPEVPGVGFGVVFTGIQSHYDAACVLLFHL